MALLAFTLHSSIQETLPRLTAMIRGIGDPLVAAYTRAYLCRVRLDRFLFFVLYFCSSFSPVAFQANANFFFYEWMNECLNCHCTVVHRKLDTMSIHNISFNETLLMFSSCHMYVRETLSSYRFLMIVLGGQKRFLGSEITFLSSCRWAWKSPPTWKTA